MMKLTDLLRLFFTLLLSLAAMAAHAQLSIEITGAGANRFPVAVSVMEGESQLPRSVTEVIRADLERSGLFSLVELGPVALPEGSLPDFAWLRTRAADAVAVGSVRDVGAGRFEVRMRLYDTRQEQQLDAIVMTMTPDQYRATAHRIADVIFEKITGLKGVFSTRIAYVVKSGTNYKLQIADSDGANAQTALNSREPIISPAWSPDGKKLAYVSFQLKKPIVYVHDLAAGLQSVVANFKGSNSAPAWSPDGQRLAVVLTKDGLSQMYTINVDGSGIQRLATSSSIDTEPAYSHDGKWIYFTSDRGGSPQIYRIPATGGRAERVTFEGSYNVTPRPSPDGLTMTFITRTANGFQVAIMDLATRQYAVLTDSSRDESPSFAPNSRMILYATEVGGRGVLSAVSSDGRIKQRLSVKAADVREPAWGPLMQ
ncbi:Tol-Pal system protein TolB [Nitrogeniibacter mangrovi]|uniref:Tol-Pal system protein TolB n=1 Tax=Nitrogeniibacter mangrovi TaxID=2016596 RepID=A0A6C1AZA4_9RHOO|nr:Tol-Pal system beta propeller repeat protein TolB [Nitrogeniibacter mangrovi]QID16682.1 Tol-Pal system protein TolB [Nitrogeniibacter mangrovi]